MPSISACNPEEVIMRRWRWLVLALGLLAGCAAETPPVVNAPLPDDLTTWSAAAPVTEPSPAPEDVPKERPASKTEKVYAFEDGNEYLVNVPLDIGADVILQAGEQVRNIAGGYRRLVEGQEQDCVPWCVKEGASESGPRTRPHLFISVTNPGLRLGLTVTTTARVYHLTCLSVSKSPIRTVRWTYPPGAPKAKPVAPASLLPDAAQPQRYHVGYDIKPSDPAPSWVPQHVVDDGRKIYILLPPQSQYADAPMLRLVGPNGPEVANVSQYKNVLIVDRLFNRAELRIGLEKTAEVVTIIRQPPRTITCPGDAECPVWPQASSVVAKE
jgi:type IV secretion system protein TrbG